jgi:Domain of unknown function (DUF4304)
MLNFRPFPISETNEAMRKALERIVVPELQRRGFTGKIPHFHRIVDARVDVLGIQFNRHGGSFVVEIGSCSTDGIRHSAENFVPADKIRYSDLLSRFRLGSNLNSNIFRDHWFSFRRGIICKTFDYNTPANEVLECLNSQAEPHWNSYIASAERG